MTYRQGEIILASDFNTFRTDMLAVYDVGFGDSGYGQIDAGGASAVPSVAIGEVIKSVEWKAFRDAAETCSVHQGSTAITDFPPDPELDVGEIVEAHEVDDGNAYDFNDGLIVITNNRLQVDAGSVSILALTSSSRVAAWSNEIQHRFKATFSTVDRARYFFNSGGQIRISGSRTGGSANTQNDSWTNMLDNMGTIVLDWTSTFKLGGGPGFTISGATIGYYDLTTSFQTLVTGVPDGGGYGGYGGYAGNSIIIQSRVTDGPSGPNGDNGRDLEFLVRYIDGHANPFFDSVDGTITSVAEYRIASSPLTVDAPVPSQSVLLTAGT